MKGRAVHEACDGPPFKFCAEASHACAGAFVLRGSGGADEKSAELLSASVQPPPFLTAAAVVEGAGAGAVSEQVAAEP